ncbi:MAG: ribonuclease P [Euryarchaeota archaeon]|nr:ribonuclease P [Euryarchaeota archaeon]
MRYYIDIGVHAFPEGADTPQRLDLTARRLGFHSIAITNHTPFLAELPDCGIVSGVEIKAQNVGELKKKIALYRRTVTVLNVHGGNDKINRAACRDERVDVLMHPEHGRHNGLNQVTAKLAKRNGIAIGFSLSYFWKTYGIRRARLLAFQRKNIALCKKFDTKIVITSDACSHYDLRAPRELKALAKLTLLEDDEAEAALSSVPLDIVQRRGQR